MDERSYLRTLAARYRKLQGELYELYDKIKYYAEAGKTVLEDKCIWRSLEVQKEMEKLELKLEEYKLWKGF